MSFFPPPPRADPKENNPNYSDKLWDEKEGLGESRRPWQPKDQKHESNPPHWKSQGKNYGNGFPSSYSDMVRAPGMESDDEANQDSSEFPFAPNQINPSPKWNHQKPRFQGGRSARFKYPGNQDETTIPLHIIIPVLVGSALLILLVVMIIYKCCKRNSNEAEAEVCDFASTPGFTGNEKMHSADNLDNFAQREQNIIAFPYLQPQIGYPQKKSAAYEVFDYPNTGAAPFNSFRHGNYNEYPQFYV